MNDELKDFLKDDDFVPFRLILTSGSSYEVTSPMQLVPEGAWLTYYFHGSDRKARLRLSQLAAIETLSD